MAARLPCHDLHTSQGAVMADESEFSLTGYPSTECNFPGCPNRARGPRFQRGYCSEHGTVAVVEVLDEIAEHLRRSGAIQAR